MPDEDEEPESTADEQDRLEEERAQKEKEELASFERRAAWWNQHYGGAKRPDKRIRHAIDQAERMPPGGESDGDEPRSESGPSEEA